MAQDLLPVWKSTFALLPPVSEKALGLNNLSAWVDERVTSKLIVSTPLLGPPSSFTFERSVFEAELQSLSLTVVQPEGAMKIANAWKVAVLASTMIAFPGSFVGVPTPATTFSVVATTTVDVSSVESGYALIVSMMSSAAVAPTAEGSILPDALYSAFAQLTYSLTGINSIVPIPTALAAPFCTVL